MYAWALDTVAMFFFLYVEAWPKEDEDVSLATYTQRNNRLPRAVAVA